MMRDDFMRQKNKIWEQKNLIKRIREDAEAKVNNSNNNNSYDNSEGSTKYKM